MEKISLQFQCRVKSLIDNGFTALEDEYLIKWIDKKYNHSFKVGELITVTIENTEYPKDDIIENGYHVIFCVIKNFFSNGFQFLDIEDSKGFFWKSRGLITHKRFSRDNFFEIQEIVKISIQRNLTS